MLCRQRHNLITSADEARVARENDRIDSPLAQFPPCRPELSFSVRLDAVEFQAKPTRRRLDVSGFAYGVRIVGVQEIADDGGCRYQLVQQLQPFRCNRPDEKAHSRDIDAWPIEARDQTEFDRVAAAGKNDWYRPGGRLSRQRRTGIGEDCGNLTGDQISGKRRSSIGLLLGPAIFDRDVLTLDVAGFLQTLTECSYIKRHTGG